MNGACDVTTLVSQLRNNHFLSQTDESKAELKWSGLDLFEGKVRNNLAHGVLEPTISKIKSIRFAIEVSTCLFAFPPPTAGQGRSGPVMGSNQTVA